MSKYIHKKGLERQQLRNYERSLQSKIRKLINGDSVELNEEEKETLDQFIIPVNKDKPIFKKTENQPKKVKVKENKDGK